MTDHTSSAIDLKFVNNTNRFNFYVNGDVVFAQIYLAGIEPTASSINLCPENPYRAALKSNDAKATTATSRIWTYLISDAIEPHRAATHRIYYGKRDRDTKHMFRKSTSAKFISS